MTVRQLSQLLITCNEFKEGILSFRLFIHNSFISNSSKLKKLPPFIISLQLLGISCRSKTCGCHAQEQHFLCIRGSISNYGGNDWDVNVVFYIVYQLIYG